MTIDIVADKMSIGGASLGTCKSYRLAESGIFNRCTAFASILERPTGNGIPCCAKAAGPESSFVEHIVKLSGYRVKLLLRSISHGMTDSSVQKVILLILFDDLFTVRL